MFKADTLDEAFDICAKLVYEGGAGHSAALYVDPTEEEKINRFAEKMKAGRILINTPTAFGGIGDLYNFDIAPSLTLGPGSAGHSAYMLVAIPIRIIKGSGLMPKDRAIGM